MDLVVQATIEDIAGALDHEEAEKLIIAVDKAMEDWEFTEKIASYFGKRLTILKESERTGQEPPKYTESERNWIEAQSVCGAPVCLAPPTCADHLANVFCAKCGELDRLQRPGNWG